MSMLIVLQANRRAIRRAIVALLGAGIRMQFASCPYRHFVAHAVCFWCAFHELRQRDKFVQWQRKGAQRSCGSRETRVSPQCSVISGAFDTSALADEPSHVMSVVDLCTPFCPRKILDRHAQVVVERNSLKGNSASCATLGLFLRASIGAPVGNTWYLLGPQVLTLSHLIAVDLTSMVWLVGDLYKEQP